MEPNILSNFAIASGTYDEEPISLQSEAVLTTLIDGLSITKTASKARWAGRDTLTYTITIENTTEMPYTGITLQDTLDTTKISFVQNTVTIDGTSVSTYTLVGSVLTVTGIPDLETGESSVITFQVRRV